MQHALSTLHDVQAWYAWSQQMRQTQPVWLDKHTGYWHVFGYADVEHVITDSRAFSSQGGCNDIPAGMDPPQHRFYRKLITSAFTPRPIERLRGRVTEITQELLGDVRSARTFDFVTALASPLPTTVIAELLGVPTADRPLFKRWADGLLSQQLSDAKVFRPQEQEINRLRETHEEVRDYFTALLQERTQAPRDDLMSALIQKKLRRRGGRRQSGGRSMTNGWASLVPVKWPIFVRILVVSHELTGAKAGPGP